MMIGVQHYPPDFQRITFIETSTSFLIISMFLGRYGSTRSLNGCVPFAVLLFPYTLWCGRHVLEQWLGMIWVTWIDPSLNTGMLSLSYPRLVTSRFVFSFVLPSVPCLILGAFLGRFSRRFASGGCANRVRHRPY
jgi:hypothetical protein